MDEFPPLPRADGAVAESGHLWLREHVCGGRLRFRYDAGLQFGDSEAVFEPGNEPLGVRRAVRAVRAGFDADAFTTDVSEPGGYTFYGIATRNEGIAYDWNRLPAFLGTDIRNPDGDRLSVDAAHRAFDRLGLAPLNVFEKELPARDFHIDRHDVPASAWYDGPAAGTRVRRKDGAETVVPGDVDPRPVESLAPAAFAEQYVTPEAIETIAAACGDDPSPRTVLDRLLARLVRRRYRELDAVDEAALREASIERVARHL